MLHRDEMMRKKCRYVPLIPPKDADAHKRWVGREFAAGNRTGTGVYRRALPHLTGSGWDRAKGALVVT
jgi:hypothetical protein